MKAQKPQSIRKTPNIFIIGVFFGLLYWLLDAAIDVYLFHEGSLTESIMAPDSEQIWMRSFIIFIFVIFSITAQWILNKRSKIERAFRESEERYRRLATASSEGIIIHDGTRIIDVNQTFLDNLGYSLDELKKMSPLECLAPESRASAAAKLRDGVEEPYDAVALRKDGSKFGVKINARTVPYGGQTVRVAAIQKSSEIQKPAEAEPDIDKNYRILFNGGNDPVLVHGLSSDGQPENFCDVNEIACKKIGYSREEFAQLNLMEITAERERDNLVPILQTLPDFKHTIFEMEILTKDGSPVPVEISSHLIDMDGKSLVISSLRETVERRKAEESLRLSEKRFREMYEDSPLAMQILDDDAHIVDVNDKWLELLGYDREDIISRWMGEFITEDKLDGFKAGFADFKDTGEMHDLKTEILNKNGESTPVSLAGKIIRDDSGNFSHACCTVINTSGEKRLEAALNEKEARIKSLTDIAENIIFTFNPDGTISDLNPIFEKLTGLPQDSWIGRNFSSLIHPDDQNFAEQTFKKCAQGEKIPPIELRIQHDNGEYLNMEFRLLSERENSRVKSIHGIASDIARQWKEKPSEAGQEIESEPTPDYQIVIDSLFDPVHVIDRDMKVVLINKAYCELCRQMKIPEDIIGKNIFEIFPSVSEEYQEKIRRIFEEGEVTTSEERFNIDEREVVIDVRRIPIFEGDSVRYMVSQIRSVTEEREARAKLQASEEKYRHLFENMAQGIIYISPESTITSANPAASEILGMENNQLIGMQITDPVWQMILEDGKKQDEDNNAIMRALIKGETVKNVILGIFNPREKCYRWINGTAVPDFKEDKDRPFQVHFTFADITEHMFARNAKCIHRDLMVALAGANSFNETLKLCTQFAINLVGMDSGGVYLYDEDTGALNLEYHQGLPKEFINKVSHYEPDSDRLHLVRNRQPVYARTEEIDQMPNDDLKREGLTFLAVVPINHNNNIIGCLNIASHSVEDLSQDSQLALETIADQIGTAMVRSKAEMAMKESEKRFRQLAENIQQVFWMSTMDDSELIYVSPAYEDIWGKSCKSLYEDINSWVDSIDDEDRQRVVEALPKKLSGDYDVEFRIIRPDNSVRWIRDRAFPVYNEYGEIYRIAGIAEDITSRKHYEMELVAERDFSEKIIKTAQAIIMVLDNKGHILSINPYMEEITGYSIDEVKNKDWFDIFIPEENRERVRSLFNANLENVQLSRAKEQIITKTGERKTIEWNNKTIKNLKDGQAIGVLATGQDITDRNQYEEELFESERRLYTLISNLPGMAYRCRCNNDCTMEFISEGCVDITGYNQNELLNNSAISYKNLIYEHDLDKMRNDVYEALEKRQSFQLIYRIVTKNGEIKWVWEKGTGVYSESGELMAMEGFVTDVNERIKAEEALLRERDLAARLAETSPAGIAVVNKDGQIIFANDAAEKVLGLTKDEITQRKYNTPEWKITDFDGNPFPEDKLPFALIKKNGGPVRDIRHAIEWSDGHKVLLSINASPLFDASGSFDGIVSTVEDITDRIKAEKSLKENEERLRLTMQNIPIMVSAFDENHILCVWNRECERVTGYSAEEMIGNPRAMEYLYPEREYFEKLKNERARKGDFRNWEREITCKDGTKKILSWSNISQQYPIPGWPSWGFGFDVTESRRAEEALRASEERYRLLVENATEGIVVIQDGFLKFVNQQVEEFTNFKKEELLSKPFLEFVYNDDKEMATEYHKQRLAGQSVPDSYDLRVYDRDGNIRWVEVSGVIITWNGQLATLNFLNDITERKQAEEKLRNSEEKFRNVVELSVDGIVLINEEGKIIEWNTGQEKISGTNRDEAIGKYLWEIQYEATAESKRTPDLKDKLKGMAMQILKTGDAPFANKYNEHEIVRPDGQRRWIQSSVFAIKTEKGFRACSLTRDITEKRLLEEELAKAEKLESVGLLAGGIAHDFNNILTAVLGNITLAKMSIDSGHEIYDSLIDAERASVRAQDLTRQLLTFSKGGAPLKKTASIVEILKESADFALRGSNVKCRHQYADDLACVEIDKGQISQVINNLIINADQAMPNGGNIELAASNVEIGQGDVIPLPEGKYIRITIRDNGVGIPNEHLFKIFDPYFTTKQKGSGLGLATSYSIIKNHNGFIDVKSHLGKGTTFTIYLPASAQTETKPAIKEVVSVSGQGRVLIMDDEEAIRKVAGMALRKLGYEVDYAVNGTEVLDKYKKAMEEGNPFDAVIMDLTIPGGMGGKEAIGKLREIDPKVKAVVSSGYYNDPIMSDYHKYGFAGIIVKPYKAGDLSTAIYQILSGRKIPTQ